MEQEKIEGNETELKAPNLPYLCSNNCGFFGSSATNSLCSKCYLHAFLSNTKVSIDAAAVPPPTVNCADLESSEKKPANRCSFCNKRIGLMGFKCRCGDVFCSLHRYSDEHNCAFDYRGFGRNAISKANPVVRPNKVEKIGR